jgi:mannosyltransferase
VPHALMALHARRKNRDLPVAGWLWTAALTTVAAAPLLYVASTQTGQVSWITADWKAVTHYPEHLFESRNLAWMLSLLGIVGASRLAGLRSGAALPLVAWALVPPLFSYVTFPLAHLFLAKYATFTLPAWALLAGAAVAAPTGIPARRAATTGQIIAIATTVLVIAGAGLEGHRYVRTSPAFGEPDFRAAARVVQAGLQPGDGIVYGGELRKARVPFVYELQSAQPDDVFVSQSAADFGWFDPIECGEPAQCLGNVRRLWLVVTSEEGDPFGPLPDSQAQLLRARFTTKSTQRFERVQVLLLVRKPTSQSLR